MTTRVGSESFLNKPPEVLEQYLFEHARSDVAPNAARERALLSVASASLGVAVVSTGAAAHGSHVTAVKATGWLIAKWLAAGLGAGLATLSVVQRVQEQRTRPPSTVERTRVVANGEQQQRLRSPNGASAVPALAEASAPIIASASVGHVSTPGAPPSGTRIEAPASEIPSRLGRELALLELARAALGRRAVPAALEALAKYRAEFPSGSLQVEAAALTIEANARAGNGEQAGRLAASFLEQFPTSPLAARVRAFANGSAKGTPKP